MRAVVEARHRNNRATGAATKGRTRTMRFKRSFARATPKSAVPASRRRSAWRQRLARAVPLVLITAAILAAGLAVRLQDPAAMRQMRNLVFDEYQRFHPHSFDPASPVRLVTIDEASLERLGQWPWPRAMLATIVAELRAMGAAAIGLDLILAEPDRMSPENIAKLLPEGPKRDALIASLQDAPRNDILLATALLDGPTVLGISLDDDAPLPGMAGASGADEAFAATKAGFAFAGDDPRAFLPGFDSATPPLALLSQAAAGLGALNWVPDRDRVVRTVPLLFQLGDGSFVPGLAAEALRVAQGASTIVVRASNASGQSAFGAKSGVNAVRIGAFDVPTTGAGGVRLHFSPTPAERQIPAWWVLEGVVDPDEIAGRIVLIGATAPGLFDIQASPIEEAIPGVEIHAQLIDHIVFGTGLERPDWAAGLEFLVFVGLALVFAVAAGVLAPFTNIAFGLITLSAVAGGSYYAFLDKGLLVDPSFPVLFGALALLATTSWVAIREGSERRWVRGAFGRYISADLVEDLATNPDRLSLGGEIRPMTILFTDIRGFTTISEGMDAQSLTAFINAFLTPLTNVILSHRGTVDKYMGDAIMAFWNAPLDDPDHATHAAEAALEMMRALDRFNEAQAGVYKPVSIGIGLNTGECCVGNLGSDQRFDYSVIGDDVNVASRLEGQTKTYGVPILVGPRTAKAIVGAGYEVTALDEIKVKGKDIAIEIFALLGGPNHPVAEAFAAGRGALDTLVAAHRAGDLTGMAAALAALEAQRAPELAAITALYRERLKILLLPDMEAAAEPAAIKALKDAGSEAIPPG
ncbi:MAG: adenylate/guanylate cyclase domain-containing protein [Pseudomonadota bacterium]